MPPLFQQIRWRILALLFIVTVINFVDRQSLSIVAPVLRDQLKLSNTDYGTIVSAFQFGMLAGELPMGALMDRRGVRFGFSFAVTWWSIANALHSLASSIWPFRLLRFWLGSGECGNYSGGVKVVSAWFPAKERAFAIGVFNGGSMVGSILAPPLLTVLMLNYGWQSAFLVPSLLGFVWVAAWLRVYRAPAEHPQLTPAERDYIEQDRNELLPEPPPMTSLLRVPQTWAIMACRMFVGPVVQFYIFWMSEYLYRRHGLDLRLIGLFTWVPYLAGDIGSIVGGLSAGAMISRGNTVTKARMWTMMIGAALCMMSLAVAASSTATAAIGFICVVLFGHTFLSANMFAAISDMFPRNAVGRVTALTGIAGGVSGMLFPLLTGYLVDKVSYTPVLTLAAIMPALGVAALFVTARTLAPVELRTSTATS